MKEFFDIENNYTVKIREMLIRRFDSQGNSLRTALWFLQTPVEELHALALNRSIRYLQGKVVARVWPNRPEMVDTTAAKAMRIFLMATYMALSHFHYVVPVGIRAEADWLVEEKRNRVLNYPDIFVNQVSLDATIVASFFGFLAHQTIYEYSGDWKQSALAHLVSNIAVTLVADPSC